MVEMCALPSYIEVLLAKIANEEGLVDSAVIVGSTTNKNDNFLGELVSVVVSGQRISENGSKKEQKLNLLCKYAPASSLERGIKTELWFGREIFFYKNVAPAFKRFQEEKNMPAKEQFTSFPKCHEAVYDPESNICAIIMRDLRPDGFQMWPNKLPTPVDRMRLIVQEMAKFHAVSFAMKDQRPEQFAEFRKLPDLAGVFLNVPHFQFVFKQSIQRATNAMESEECKTIMAECLRNYNANCLNGKFSDQSCVVTHGDCWKNNIIFRSGVSTKGEQILRLGEMILLFTHFSGERGGRGHLSGRFPIYEVFVTGC